MKHKLKNSKHLYFLILIFILIAFFGVIYYLSNYRNKNEYFNTNPNTNNNKYVCLYTYYEKNEDYKNNFQFFLDNGILDNVNYYIIVNGKSTINIPQKDNIKSVYRENKGYDFGAWSYGLTQLDKKYDYYIFINTSVIGPYITKNDKIMNRNWLDKFMELFNKDDVKLVGTTINMCKRGNDTATHIQSMFFILTHESLSFLQSNDFFNEADINNYGFQELIEKKEIGMSQLILKNNWNINCIVPYYRDQDYRTLKTNINQPENITDVLFKNAFFGRTLTPEETIFYKKWRFM